MKDTHLLDYLHHCTASGKADLRGGSATLGALCSAAQRSMEALEAAGLPAMALEALSIARALYKGTFIHSHVRSFLLTAIEDSMNRSGH